MIYLAIGTAIFVPVFIAFMFWSLFRDMKETAFEIDRMNWNLLKVDKKLGIRDEYKNVVIKNELQG